MYSGKTGAKCRQIPSAKTNGREKSICVDDRSRDLLRWTRDRSCHLSDLWFSAWLEFHARNLATPSHRSHGRSGSQGCSARVDHCESNAIICLRPGLSRACRNRRIGWFHLQCGRQVWRQAHKKLHAHELVEAIFGNERLVHFCASRSGCDEGSRALGLKCSILGARGPRSTHEGLRAAGSSDLSSVDVPLFARMR